MKKHISFESLSYQNNFGKKEKLRSQSTAVNENRQFNCTKCEQSFTLRHQLQNHFTSIHERKTKIHNALENEGKKLFECVNCGSKFTQKASLNFHKGKKCFICRICTSSFIRKSNLNEHIKHVHNKRRFSCDTCSATFTKKSNLATHATSVHGEIMYNCQICTKTLTVAVALRKQISKIHKEKTYDCILC